MINKKIAYKLHGYIEFFPVSNGFVTLVFISNNRLYLEVEENGKIDMFVSLPITYDDMVNKIYDTDVYNLHIDDACIYAFKYSSQVIFGSKSELADKLYGLPNLNLDNDINYFIEEHSNVYKVASLNLRNTAKEKHLQADTFTNNKELKGYDLSTSQRRLWFINQFDQVGTYNIGRTHILKGNLNYPALKISFETLICRHEILRTAFRQDEEGNPKQFIKSPDQIAFSVHFEDLCQAESLSEILQKLVRVEFTKPFNFTEGPLFRVALFQVSESKWILTYVTHQLISDEQSLTIILQEFLTLYQAYCNADENPLPSIRIHYKDYAAWEQEWLQSEEMQEHRIYWSNQLEGERPTLDLPTDYPRPPIKTYNGGGLRYKLNAEKMKKFKIFCQQENTSLSIGFTTVIAILLYRYTNQDDFVIGVSVLDNRHPDLKNQIGYYENMLPLKIQFQGQNNSVELLDLIKEITSAAYSHKDFPFDELVEVLSVERDISRNALFDVLITFKEQQKNDVTNLILDELSVSDWMMPEDLPKRFDLNFELIEVGKEIELHIEYNSDIYSLATTERMSMHIERLIAAITTHPYVSIHQIDYLTDFEKAQFIVKFNETSATYPRDKTIAEIFEQQASKTPHSIALVFEGIELTYAELNRLSNRLANYLKLNYNLFPDDLIAIRLDRSHLLIIALLGVLKSDAAYLPLQTDYPLARINYILDSSGSKLVIDEQFIQHFLQQQFNYSNSNPLTRALPNHLAYIIYTSGSTGVPKGVMVEHRSVVRLVRPGSYANLTGDEILLSTGAVSFDATTFEYWATLLNGGRLIMCRNEVILNANLLEDEINRRGVNMMWFTSGLLNQLVDENINLFAGLKTLLAGGEKLSSPHIKKLRLHYPYLNILNCYGPTENTTFSLTYPIELVDENIPMGKPINNSTVYILDQHLNLVPEGVKGEICVGGDGLARGYLNREELTREKFIKHPFLPNERIYRTGDLGRWLPKGNIEFLGRSDYQVKIRGYRVELQEIEKILEEHPEIEAAAVLLKTINGPKKDLVAYVTGSINLFTDVRIWLSKHLPSYMIPRYFVRLYQMPLTANGKIDRRSLPDPDVNMSLEMAYTGPRNDIERKLVAIWQEFLGKEQIGIKDDFFELGGSSITVIRLLSHFHRHFNVTIQIKDLFMNTTIEEQATLILKVISASSSIKF